MQTLTYRQRRGQIKAYFDRTAANAWSRLTSQAPVGRIRATVRAGRDAMRNTLLDWLPQDLEGRRLFDAGCGTGALSIEAARRGADVLGVDLSPTMLGMARERVPRDFAAGRIQFLAGDMLDSDFGRFDHIVLMDSLIHYQSSDAIRALAELSGRANVSILFTFAPRTAALSIMHAVGRLFPRADRAPAIEPVREERLVAALAGEPGLAGWRLARRRRIANGFYVSQAMELVRA